MKDYDEKKVGQNAPETHEPDDNKKVLIPVSDAWKWLKKLFSKEPGKWGWR